MNFPMAVWSLIGFFLVIFWMYQLAQLMVLEDGHFPGRHDKPLWVAIFIFTGPIGAFSFLMWKKAREVEIYDSHGPIK